MKILIKKTITKEESRSFEYFVHSSIDGLHTLLFNRTPLSDNISSVHIKDYINEAFQNQIASSVNLKEYDCKVEDDGDRYSNSKIFTLEEATRYIKDKALIVVENSLNDGEFVIAIEKYFGEKGLFDKYTQKNLVKFDEGGGKNNIPNHLDGLLRGCQRRSKFLRCVVIVDGDERYRGENDKNNMSVRKTIQDKCDELFIECHFLRKRAIENYMPDEVFKNNTAVFGGHWVNAYLNNLTPEQKDYFCIAEGFSKDVKKEDKSTPNFNKNHLSPEKLKNYYNNVSDSNFEKLKFGPSVPGGSFKDGFPKYFTQSPFVTKETLLNRASTTDTPDSIEFEEIVEMISKIL